MKTKTQATQETQLVSATVRDAEGRVVLFVLEQAVSEAHAEGIADRLAAEFAGARVEMA